MVPVSKACFREAMRAYNRHQALSSDPSHLQVYKVDDKKAWSAVGLTVLAVAFSTFLIAASPWYLLPFAWAFAGTAWTGVSLIHLIILMPIWSNEHDPSYGAVAQHFC